jgi:hypothetical protein
LSGRSAASPAGAPMAANARGRAPGGRVDECYTSATITPQKANVGSSISPAPGVRGFPGGVWERVISGGGRGVTTRLLRFDPGSGNDRRGHPRLLGGSTSSRAPRVRRAPLPGWVAVRPPGMPHGPVSLGHPAAQPQVHSRPERLILGNHVKYSGSARLFAGRALMTATAEPPAEGRAESPRADGADRGRRAGRRARVPRVHSWIHLGVFVAGAI